MSWIYISICGKMHVSIFYSFSLLQMVHCHSLGSTGFVIFIHLQWYHKSQESQQTILLSNIAGIWQMQKRSSFMVGCCTFLPILVTFGKGIIFLAWKHSTKCCLIKLCSNVTFSTFLVLLHISTLNAIANKPQSVFPFCCCTGSFLSSNLVWWFVYWGYL